jgi:murein L,D-transpeptidase YafK
MTPLLPFLAALSLSTVHSHPAVPDTAGPSTVIRSEATYRIVIDKSDYELTLYEDGEWVAKYPVVFGSKDQGDKQMEGDRRTPEGTFRITQKKQHAKWGCFLLLDYPNRESISRFNQRKKEGLIPSHARIGGGIGIHGTRPHEEYAVDKYINWTEGCISLKYSEVFELFELLPVGTEVEIRK